MNRFNPEASNPHGIIIGEKGSGKTTIIKEEIKELLKDNEDKNIFIIDTDGSYDDFINEIGGLVIDVKKFPVNPLDFIPFANDFKNSIAFKADAIADLIEVKNGKRLTPAQRNCVDKATKCIYENYSIDMKNEERKIDRHALFAEFIDILAKDTDSAAKEVASMISDFKDTFAEYTSISSNANPTVYKVDESNMSLSYLACAMDICNRLIENSEKKKKTYIYFENIDVLKANESALEFLSSIWSKARTNWGILMATNSRTEVNPDWSKMKNNSGFIYLLKQQEESIDLLKDVYDLSEDEQKILIDAKEGKGILIAGGDKKTL